MPCGLGLSIVYSGGWVSKAYTVYTRTNKHTTVCTVPKTVWISTLEPILLYIRLEQIQRYAMQRYNMQRYTMQRYTMQRYTELCNGILCNGLQCNSFCQKYFTISKTHTVVLHPLDSRKRLVFLYRYSESMSVWLRARDLTAVGYLKVGLYSPEILLIGKWK